MDMVGGFIKALRYLQQYPDSACCVNKIAYLYFALPISLKRSCILDFVFAY